MAKKKKASLKPVANRGFATTSTPSKKPVPNEDESSHNFPKATIDASVDPSPILSDDKECEQEEQDEESSALQTLVDRLAEKVDKDINRFWKVRLSSFPNKSADFALQEYRVSSAFFKATTHY